MGNAIFEQFAGRMGMMADGLRKRLADDNMLCFLLKAAGHTEKFTVVRQLSASDGWWTEFINDKAQIKLFISNSDPALIDEIATASFIATGVPDSDGQLEVFSIDADKRDVTAPMLPTPFWQIVAIKETEERYTV